MDQVTFSGNQLYVGSREMREWSCSRAPDPAHYRPILHAQASPTGKLVVSLDKGGDLKLWDLSRPALNERIWKGSIGHADEITAIGVADDGSRLALAAGLTVRVYELRGSGALQFIEQVNLAVWAPQFTGTIVQLAWIDNDHVTCIDEKGVAGILTRQPLWKIE